MSIAWSVSPNWVEWTHAVSSDYMLIVSLAIHPGWIKVLYMYTFIKTLPLVIGFFCMNEWKDRGMNEWRGGFQVTVMHDFKRCFGSFFPPTASHLLWQSATYGILQTDLWWNARKGEPPLRTNMDRMDGEMMVGKTEQVD